MHARTALLLLTLAACDERRAPIHKDTGEDGAATTTSAQGFRWSDDAVAIRLDGKLQAQAVETTRVGPWISRTAGAGPGAASGGLLARVSRAAGMPMMEEASLDMAPPAPTSMSTPVAGAGPLRAGSTDDNRSFTDYLTYLEGSYTRPDMAEVGGIERLNVATRRAVQVLDAAGAPLPGARVSIVDSADDRLIWTGRTYGDGRVPFFPDLYAASTTEAWTVQAEWDGQLAEVSWPADGASELDVRMDVSPVRDAVKVDVCFIIDTTGSMSDEIDRVKQTLLTLTARLTDSEAREVDLNYGAVLYRDIGDEYLTQAHPLTGDIKAFDKALQGIQANGGGDGPESLNQGLAVAMGGMDWRAGAARVAFLIADAPPHMDYQEDISYARSALAAIHSGVRIHTVAASGLDDRGSLVFRQVAQLSRGKFIFIEYGSAAASAADHGVTGPVASNNLDAILYEQIRAEIQGWGREDSAVATAAR